MNDTRKRALWFAAVLLLCLPIFVLIATGYSAYGREGIVAAMRVILTNVGIVSEPIPEHKILSLRLIRALCAIGVGGSLALAGAMSQGLFRNPLAAPDLLGVGSGAMLGAVLAIAALGDYGPDLWSARATFGGNLLRTVVSVGIVPVCAFIGALATAVVIYRLATRRGRISIPILLLTGLAINALLGAAISGLQALLINDWQVSRAIVAWAFGTLDDRTSFHVLIVTIGAVIALATIPFVGLELDLMSGGEEDAAALGANPARVKMLVLASVALATGASVSVSGQIAFIGLLVPHVMRMLVGPHHRLLLPLSFLAGANLLLGVVVFQNSLCPTLAELFHGGWVEIVFRRISTLQPGVLTSLLGAPFFIYLLFRQESHVRNW